MTRLFARGRRRPRGFSLLETMMAGAIFLIGFTGLTALLVSASVRRSRASKRAVIGRMAYDEYTRVTTPGYDAMPDPGVGGASVVLNRTETDPLGRDVTFVTTIIQGCTEADTTFGMAGQQLNAEQGCCAQDTNGVGSCCRTVRVQAQMMLNGETGELLTDNFVGFVTKGCLAP